MIFPKPDWQQFESPGASLAENPRTFGLQRTTRYPALLFGLLLIGRLTGVVLIAAEPAAHPVKLMINWDEQGMWRSQLEVAKRQKQTLDANTVREIVETAVDEHAKAGFDRIAYCGWVRFGSPVPGFVSAPFQKDYYGRAPGFGRFHEAGFDQIQILNDRCHEHGMQFLLCLRMNDRHGIAQHEQFYLEHPEWRLTGAPSLGGLDYKYDGVRAPVLEFIEEALQRYDIDGIELDYMRWCHVFEPSEAVANTPLLTEFTRKARRILNAAGRRRGRRLLLGTRIPQTLDECRALGFDIRTWIQDELVDYICPSDFFFTDFNIQVDRFDGLTKGTNCRIYPAIHPLICVGHPENIKPMHYRAAATNYYAMGADGIATYNFMYNWRRWTGGDRGLVDGWPKTLSYVTELRDLEQISGQHRKYLYYPLWNDRSQSGGIKHDVIKIDRTTRTSDKALRFRLAEDLSNPHLAATMTFKVTGLDDSDELNVQINGTTVPAENITRTFDADGLTPEEDKPLDPFYLYRFALDADLTKFGDNHLNVTLARTAGRGDTEIVVTRVDVDVTVNTPE